ncbi:MAG: hypothetical protein EBU66_19230 [Bacteroidetes bacterium]|nr:hypothetical protein [bacterium]NBP66767.1 hypothetical protein [Bacteroidota bacterium]
MIALKVERPMIETQEQLKESTVEFINELISENYAQDDIYEFIAEHGENDLVQYYVKYVEIGESYSYRAVDIFIEEFGIDNVEKFEDAFRGGGYASKADYAEQFVSDCYCIDLPAFIEIDWETTFDNLDCVYVDGFVFDTQF